MVTFGQKRTSKEIKNMFTWLNKQGVRSSDGFEVQSIDRFAVEYREGNLVATIPVEPGSYGGSASISIPACAFAKWDNSAREITKDNQAQMRANFVAAMRFQNIAVEL